MKLHIRIDVVPDVPPEISRSLLPMLRDCQKYIPSWVQTIIVQFITSVEGVRSARGSYAEVVTNPSYYAATLRILPRWLDECAADRRKSLIHEIGHMHHADAYHMARQAVTHLAMDDSHRELLLAQLRDEFEKSAEGFALMVARLEGR